MIFGFVDRWPNANTPRRQDAKSQEVRAGVRARGGWG